MKFADIIQRALKLRDTKDFKMGERFNWTRN